MEYISKRNRFKERCHQICGDGSSPCFIDNSKQIACISDMVINKVFAIKTIVDRLREDNQYGEISEFLDAAYDSVDELINWVRYLQAVQIRW